MEKNSSVIDLKKMRRVWEEQYRELKEDPVKLEKERRDCQKYAIESCLRDKEKYDLAKTENGDMIERAIDRAIEALQNGDIQDGIPRLLFAWLIGEPNENDMWLDMRWVESDFDTSCIIVRDESNGITIEQNLLEHRNLEKNYMFAFYRCCAVDLSSVSELGIGTRRNLYVLLKYMGKDMPEFPRMTFGSLSPGVQAAKVYVPNGKFSVSLRDRAGHESNQLPVVRLTNNIRKLKKHTLGEELNALMPGLVDACEMYPTSTKSP